MRKQILCMTLGIVTLLTTGCPMSPEKARDGVALAYGFIGDIQTKHLDECRAAPTAPTCVLINKGVAVQRLAAGALNEYCAGPPKPGDATYATGGPCSVQPGLEPRLQAALTDLSNVMNDIKKLGGN